MAFLAHLQLSNIGAGLVAVVLSYITWTFTYAFLLSPLRDVPGPWWARVTRIPQWYANWHWHRTAYYSDLLNQHGKGTGVVIVASNEVFTNDEASLQFIFSKDTTRPEWYRRLVAWKGEHAIMGHPNHKAMPFRQDMLRLFSGANLAALNSDVTSHMDGLLSLIDADIKANRDSDTAMYMKLLALDIVTDIAWGEKHRYLETIPTGAEPDDFLRALQSFGHFGPMLIFFPIFRYWVEWSPFGTKQWREHGKNIGKVVVLAQTALSRWKEQKEHRQRDYMSAMEARGVSEDSMMAHLIELLAAASTTTERACCFALALLRDHPDIQNKLRRELTKAFPRKEDIQQKRMLDLPYLDAFVRESLRLNSPSPGPQQRYLAAPMTVGGLTIPAGTIASAAPHTQQRLPNVFPEPEACRPERWLTASKEQLTRMNHNCITFGYGLRICPGMNLALVELKFIFGTLVRHYTVLGATSHENPRIDENIDLFHQYFKTKNCWLRFEKTDA